MSTMVVVDDADVRVLRDYADKGGAMHTFTNTGKVTATIVEVFGKAKK